MPPTTVVGVIAFFLLAVPGIVFQLLGERRRPGWEESTARETGRIVLASVVFTGLSLLVIAILRILKPSWMPDPGAWLRQGNEYVQMHYRLIVRTMVLELTVAVGFAVLANWLFRRGSSGRLQRVSAWFTLFRLAVPEGARPFARVHLKNGDTYTGYVLHYSEELPLADRELILGPPVTYQAADGSVQDLDEGWQRITIPGTEVRALWVSYVRTLNVREPKTQDDGAEGEQSAESLAPTISQSPDTSTA